MHNKRLLFAHSSNSGFTLIELMIVVAIVAILLALAFPSYSEFVRKGNRSIARTHLLDIANRQQEFFLNNKTYAASLADLGFTAASMGISSKGEEVAAGAGNSVYAFSITSAGANAYALSAAPQNSQTQDTKCGTFSLNSNGTKAATGSLGIECWD